MTEQTGPPPPIIRPNGKPYRPRRLSAHAVVANEDELTGIIIFGTHDPGAAQPLADRYVTRWLEDDYCAVDPVVGWWRDGFGGGSRVWVADDVRGRAGVWFREIAERSP